MVETVRLAVQRADWPEAWLRTALAYEPKDLALFRQALTHRSASGPSNERLEFLGDAVLNLVVTEHLYARYPSSDEGHLTRLRARVVSATPLAEVGVRLGVGDVIQMGGGELQSGGFRRESMLADAIEALIGAVLLDGGFESARVVVLRLFDAAIERLDSTAILKDSKTQLQELLQGRAAPLPAYELQRVEGEPHAQTFHVNCSVEFESRRVSAQASGVSRRRAEQAAAQNVLDQLQPGGRT
jgi:ribonuclease-3